MFWHLLEHVFANRWKSLKQIDKYFRPFFLFRRAFFYIRPLEHWGGTNFLQSTFFRGNQHQVDLNSSKRFCGGKTRGLCLRYGRGSRLQESLLPRRARMRSVWISAASKRRSF